MSSQSGKPPVDWEAVARYLAGESPVAERESVQAWLARNPEESAAIASLDVALNRLALRPEDMKGIDVEAALAAVNARRQEAAPTPLGRTLELRQRSRIWIPIAAAAP